MTDDDRIFVGAAIFLAQSERIRGGSGKKPLAASPTSKASRKDIGKAIAWSASLETELQKRNATPTVVYNPPLAPGTETVEESR